MTSEIQVHATGLASQYIAQVTGDLERNIKEQERLGAEIDALQQQLGALQHDHSVLVSMQEALGGANPAGEADTTAEPTVPRQAIAVPRHIKPTKAATTSANATAAKRSAARASSAKAPPAKAPNADTNPTLINLIRCHVEQQSEPLSTTEVSAALTQAYPDAGSRTPLRVPPSKYWSQRARLSAPNRARPFFTLRRPPQSLRSRLSAGGSGRLRTLSSAHLTATKPRSCGARPEPGAPS
ncbi:hypothetical protein ACFVZT_12100 [Streptomyces sp. NPDC058321]|uniref:hypothetical protein n=1 Tax=Streptomyces sp. NPDC058321 TaxID=3346445 RepID=UPI0036DFDDC8